MTDYIERQAFIDDIKTEIINLSMDGMKGTMMPHDELYGFIERIKEQPAANVREDVQGEWVNSHWKGSTSCANCSLCNFEAQHSEFRGVQKYYKLCPNCGARMTGGNKK